jgi:hypothetical protein
VLQWSVLDGATLAPDPVGKMDGVQTQIDKRRPVTGAFAASEPLGVSPGLGAATAVQSATLFGVTGLIMAGTGAYLVVLGTWQFSSRLLFAVLSLTNVGAVLSLATPVLREWLFGNERNPGLVGTHAYWLGAHWWRPLVVVGAIALAVTVTVIAAAEPGRR